MKHRYQKLCSATLSGHLSIARISAARFSAGCYVFFEDLLFVSELRSHSGEERLNVARSQELIQGEPPNFVLIFCVPHLLC